MMDKISKAFSIIIGLGQILMRYPPWFKGALALWILGGLAIFVFFIVRYPYYANRPTGRPVFVTDRTDGNEIGFTVFNPGDSCPVRLVDISLVMFSYSEYMAASEDRFDLSKVDVSSGQTPTPGRSFLNMDLSKAKSIFYSDKIITIDRDDAASFTVRLFANEHLSSCTFRLVVVYIDDKGQKRTLKSDCLYSASKGFGETEISHLGSTTAQKLVEELEKHNYIEAGRLPCFEEHEYSVTDLFRFLLQLYDSGTQTPKDTWLLIDALNNYATTKERRSLILHRIEVLDDVNDFGNKIHFLQGLVRWGDRRVIPHVQSFVRSTEQLEEVVDPINVHGALEWLHDDFQKAFAQPIVAEQPAQPDN